MDPQKPSTKISIPMFSAPPKQPEAKPAALPNKIRIPFGIPIQPPVETESEQNDEDDDFDEDMEDEMSQPDSYEEPEVVEPPAPIIIAPVQVPPVVTKISIRPQEPPQPKAFETTNAMPLKISFALPPQSIPAQQPIAPPQQKPPQPIQSDKPLIFAQELPLETPKMPSLQLSNETVGSELAQTAQALDELKLEVPVVESTPQSRLQESTYVEPQPPAPMPTVQVGIPKSDEVWKPVVVATQDVEMVQAPPEPVVVETLLPQISIQTKPPKAQTIPINVTDLYKVVKRSVSLQLDPASCTFKGQTIIELALNLENATKIMEHYQQKGVKLKVEAYLIAKQIEIVNVFQLVKENQTFRKDKNLQLRSGGLEKPAVQATVQQTLFQKQPRNLYQLDQLQRQQYTNELKNGTSSLKKKFFSIKTKKTGVDKLYPTVTLLIEYICAQVTSVGGVQRVVYTKDREEIINNQDKEASYFLTTDLPDQSLCWLPQLVGSQRMASQWNLKFIVPKEFMVVASGVQTQRVVDQEGLALHEYALQSSHETTVPDKIGFVCTLFPYITEVDLRKKDSSMYACFVSKQRQQFFNPKFVQEVVEYLQSLLHHPHPNGQTQLIFLPNLFAAKAPKQRMSFAGGLHLLDQELLFKSSQIDKRHHTYKQLAAALTFDYFGSLVREMTFSDSWLLVAICERIGDRFKKKKCGILLYRYHVYRNIERLYKQMKHGIEVTPLQRQSSANQASEPEELFSLGCTHPAENLVNDVFFRKCSLIFHMIESNIDESNLDKIIREMFVEAISGTRELSQLVFRKKFKKICGLKPKSFYYNWIWATSCPKLELSYEFNKRNNSLDLSLKQTSAVRDHFMERKNIDSKLSKIFSLPPNRQKFELLKDTAYPGLGIDCFYVQMQQASRRWFFGDINIVIYQVEGSGGDILKQQHKMSLKEFKSSVSAHIPLQGRVKRTMQNKKKDFDMLLDSSKISNQALTGRDKQAEQLVLNTDVWKFEMNEFELEEFPQETKNIFLGRELDNNPVLWIRVDPDMEYVRQVKVVQQKRNNWLFQLLRENDIIGQIEAVKQLHKFNEELVYEILKTVSRNDNYFFKVRKHVFRALQKMEICAFNKYISHEMFLLKFYNSRNFDETTGFYKENNFAPLLEYYLDISLISAIAKCKEERLPLAQRKQEEVDKLRQKRDELLMGTIHEDAASSDANAVKDGPLAQTSGTAIQINLAESQLVSSFSLVNAKKLKETKLVEESLYSTTTKVVAEMLMKVLEQNDNSTNPVDDSFFLRNLLSNLGRLDNLALMPRIAAEIHRQFKLDQISNASPHYAITIGAIKGFYNMRKQIFTFVHQKAPNLDENSVFTHSFAEQIRLTEEHLDLMYQEVQKLLTNHAQHLRIRLFIFQQEMRHAFLYKQMPFVKALLAVLNAIRSQNQKLQVRFATCCLRELAFFLENEEFVGGRLAFTDVLMDNELSREVNDLLWELVCQPHCYLSPEFLFWVKRVYRRLYGSILPEFLRAKQPSSLFSFEADQNWSKSEAQLHAEDSLRQQAQADTLEAQKQMQQYARTQNAPEPPTTKIRLDAFQKAGKVVSLKPYVPEASAAYKISIGNFGVQVPQAPPISQNTKFKIGIARTVDKMQDREESWEDDGDVNMDGSDDRALNGSQEEDRDEDWNENEPETDPFAERVTDDEVLHACWKILGELYYHFDSTDFLEPINEDRFGPELYEDYCETIKEPMDFKTMQEKFYRGAYRDKFAFWYDMKLVFNNCREYNAEGSDIYTSATKLERFFHELWVKYGLNR